MNKKLFEKIKTGLEEMVAHEQGKIKLKTKVVYVFPPPKTYKARDIKRIRSKEKCTQYSFANMLNVSIKTVQAWESGQRIPSGAALRLLEIVDQQPARASDSEK